MWRRVACAAVVASVVLSAPRAHLEAQIPPPVPDRVQKLGPNLFAIDRVRVDTAKHEVSAPAKLNAVQTLEFIANARESMKAYESAITVDCTAINFNAALLLVGLDQSRGRATTRHFDSRPPEGDRVDIWIELENDPKHARIPVEQLMYDQQTKKTVTGSTWVYTGSMFMPDGRYLAETDGLIVGFVHSPSPLIEQVGGSGVDRYGQIILNPNPGFPLDAALRLFVKALPRGAAK